MSDFVEGKEPPFRIVINGRIQAGGFETFEQALATIQQVRLQDFHYEIAHRRKVVWPAPTE